MFESVREWKEASTQEKWDEMHQNVFKRVWDKVF